MLGMTSSYGDAPLSLKQRRPSLCLGALLLLFLLSLGGLVSGCSVQLAPDYDKATYDSLAELNVQTETLFASLSSGGSAADFAAHKPIYDGIIGGFSAARMLTDSRAIPPLSSRLLATPLFKTACGGDPAKCVNQTPLHLKQIIDLLTGMRDAHKRGGLSAALVVGFKLQYELEMQRVLVFEAALQR